MWSTTLHSLSIITVIFASAALVLAWLIGGDVIAGNNVSGLLQGASVLYLASIAFGVLTMVHVKEESGLKKVTSRKKKK